MIESFSRLVSVNTGDDVILLKDDEINEYFEAVSDFLRLQYVVPQQALCLIQECLGKLCLVGKTNKTLVDEIKKTIMGKLND